MTASARDIVIESSRAILDGALAEGLTLREFQAQADQVLARASVDAGWPWYWETVYRTNLQSSYQVGRFKQMAYPEVLAEPPFLRYVSARLPASRASHVEKHGLVYAASALGRLVPAQRVQLPLHGHECLQVTNWSYMKT